MPYINETGVKKPPRLKLNVDSGGGGREEDVRGLLSLYLQAELQSRG